jgi:hypothetical protein
MVGCERSLAFWLSLRPIVDDLGLDDTFMIGRGGSHQ